MYNMLHFVLLPVGGIMGCGWWVNTVGWVTRGDVHVTSAGVLETTWSGAGAMAHDSHQGAPELALWPLQIQNGSEGALRVQEGRPARVI